jgi:hypothetical protein
MESFSTTFFCPTYSSSVGGRRVWLKLSSSFEIKSGDTRRTRDIRAGYREQRTEEPPFARGQLVIAAIQNS